MRICIGVAAVVAMTLLSGASPAEAAKRKTPVKSAARPYSPPTAAMAVDLNSGQVLHSSNAAAPRYPASITKVMTLYLLFDALRDGKLTPDTELQVSEFAASQMPTKLGLKPGSTIKVKDAVGALVTKSANDAAVVVAEALAGSQEEFARRMTQKARQIGMTNTTFRNASGLPHPEQQTTAQDLITLGRSILEDHPARSKVFNTRHFFYGGRAYRNHNALLFSYRGMEGMKTGFTSASGFNLIASAKRNEKHVMAVVLGGSSARSRDATMRTILDASWRKATAGQLERRTVMASAELPRRRIEAGAGGGMGAVRRAPADAAPRMEPRTVRAAAVDERQGATQLAPPARPSLASPTPRADPVADAMLDRAKFAAAAAAEPKFEAHQEQPLESQPVNSPLRSGVTPDRLSSSLEPLPGLQTPDALPPARVSFHPGRGALYTSLLGTDEPEDQAEDAPPAGGYRLAEEALSDPLANSSVHVKVSRAEVRSAPAAGDTQPPARALVQAVAAEAQTQPALVLTALDKPGDELAQPVYPGPFHIQIGAFADASAAKARRERAESIAGASLGGHPFFTMTVEAGEGTLVRARFAGFDERQAKRVCASLKRGKIDCLILRAPTVSAGASAAAR